jgi:hypothetical protein
MKNLFVLCSIAVVITACGGKSKQVQDFIPGTYVNAAEGEFGVAKDTLLISSLDGLHYLMVRRTAFRAIRKGRMLPVHLTVKRFECVYDPARLELSEPQNGRVFRFDPAQGVLLIHQAVYRKLR